MTEQSTVDGPARNDAMIREVVRHIRIMPHKWYQRAWALTAERRQRDDNSYYTPAFRAAMEAYEAAGGQCGTTFCVAGWAARIGGYVDENARPTQKIRDWVTQHDFYWSRAGEVPADDLWINQDGQVYDNDLWISLGAEILGIPYNQAKRIFDADFAGTVPQLIASLSAVLGMTFDKEEDPHAV